MNAPLKRVAVTGAAGNIAYQAIFRIAAGHLYGEQQPVALQLLDIPPALPALAGTAMELEDCAFPLLREVVCTADAGEAFGDADCAFLFGARPRGKGMERSDLLAENGKIFGPQGRALNDHARRGARVLVIGNPANTNALIALRHAPDLEPAQFAAMSRLDHDRARAQLALHAGAPVGDVRRMTVWGNHSPAMHPDLSYCLVAGRPAGELAEPAWYRETFIPLIQRRGAQVIEARGASSAASAANAALAHMRDWVHGTAADDWVSMSVLSDGHYGLAEGLIYSLPCRCRGGRHEVVEGLELDDFARAGLQANEAELLAERDAVRDLLD